MRHTITMTIEVESTSRSARKTAEALLGYITSAQDERFQDDIVYPDGREVKNYDLTLSVGSAEALGVKVTAGWAIA